MAPNVGEIRSSIDVGLMFFRRWMHLYCIFNFSTLECFHGFCLPQYCCMYFFPGGVSSRQLSSAYIVLLETIGPNYVHRQQQPGCASQWPHVKITHELHPRECFCTHCMFWVQNTVFSFPRVCCICFADVVCFAHCIGFVFLCRAGQHTSAVFGFQCMWRFWTVGFACRSTKHGEV